ncbi:hypothetical protein DFJ77DRAFT_347310 [Powellomyces hirtus]|nr:hypothetical protein DFJ77DRAFT_347310 [Powellomyces hirtus]
MITIWDPFTLVRPIFEQCLLRSNRKMPDVLHPNQNHLSNALFETLSRRASKSEVRKPKAEGRACEAVKVNELEGDRDFESKCFKERHDSYSVSRPKAPKTGIAAKSSRGRQGWEALEAVLNARRAKFAELEHELELLNTFQEISITSPSTLATQHSNAIALQKTLQTRHVQTLEKIRAQDESDRRDMEGVFASRILGIVAVTKRGIPKSDQAVLQHSMQTSARLQKEIDMHLCVQEEITQDIERVKRDRVEAKRLKVALRDPRRKVLTCPPDMTVLSDEL